ncbi:MAG TPA: multicopper oxidase domain-containing protein [Geobacteraceae bacterium]|nr:multicopper oxidase domain-containing protein [Geobacteraceae bacterium]
MNRTLIRNGFLFIVAMTVLVGLFLHPAQAVILGETGTAFNLTAMEGSIRTGDGDSVPMWLFAVPDKVEQYPGPTLIVNQGDTVSVTLTNQLKVPVSLLFPGQKVTVTNSVGGVPGLLTTEVPPDNGNSSVTYTFIAAQPGTYTYYSGTQPELEVEMGLQGAIVVRPAGFNATQTATALGGRKAFTNVSTAYDREYLMLLSEIDVEQHKAAGRGELRSIDHTDRRPVTWFENGRTMPDTVADPGASYLPSQPYNSFPQSHPGEKILIRFVGAGLDLHPLHTHGQNHLQIARDGRLLNSVMSNDLTPDLGVSDYTTTVVPGETVDAIYGVWTAAKLDWDIYGPKEGSPGFGRTINWDQFVPLAVTMPGHQCIYPNGTVAPLVSAACNQAISNDPNCFDPVTHEYCPDHDKDFPVQLPTQTELTFGNMWGGTPFLGALQTLPPVNTNDGLFHSQQNPQAGISFMWHSHNEREITTNNIFLGGMATMSLILPYCSFDPVTGFLPVQIDADNTDEAAVCTALQTRPH